MHYTFVFLLAVLATFRLAVMFSKESGPGRIFKKLRAAPPPKSATREGLSCTLCESVWWSALITVNLAVFHQLEWGWTPLYWLAVSAGAVILNMQWTKKL